MIRRSIILVVPLLLFLNSSAQTNLIPNPSFEDLSSCPMFLDQVYLIEPWDSYRSSPDCYNSCNNFELNVPNALWGTQNSHTGNGFVGFYTYRSPTFPTGSNYRESVGTQLLAPLIQGAKYYFSFYINFSGSIMGYASDNLGFKLSLTSFSVANPIAIDNLSMFHSTLLVTDSINWTRFSGSFIADSSYGFIAFGNFYQDSLTQITYFINSQRNEAAYYYLDDVCLTTDSFYNENWTSLSDIRQNDLGLIYYNGNSIIIKSENIIKFHVFDMIGKEVKPEYLLNMEELLIKTDDFKSGVYLIKISTNFNFKSYKIFKL